MMGRAGRPQYDQHGKAVILVHEPKKSFYKKVKLRNFLLSDMGNGYKNLEMTFVHDLLAVSL